MPIPTNALVLVIDRQKMLFLRNHGAGDQIELVTETFHQQELGEDRAGEPDQSETTTPFMSGRASLDQSDFQMLDESRNGIEAADQLRMRALAGDFEALVIIAPPKTLGDLRKALHSEVERRIVMELPKDMTDRPLPDIAAMLTGRSAPAD